MTTNEIMALVEELQSAIEVLQADAARYRWLRVSRFVQWARYHDLEKYSATEPKELDAAIDAAMALDKQKG